MTNTLALLPANRTSLLIDVHMLVAQYAGACQADVIIHGAQPMADIKLSKLWDAGQYPYAIKVNVYSVIRKGNPVAIINWNTMGNYTTDFCRAYMQVIGIAVTLAEKINELYEARGFEDVQPENND